MSIKEIKSEMVELSAEARQELTAFLASLRHRDDPKYRKRMGHKIDDNSPDNWVTLDEFDKKLGIQ